MRNYHYTHKWIPKKKHAPRSERSLRTGQLTKVKERALEKGLDFNITVDDLDWPTHCPILGIELHRGLYTTCSPSVDRIIPELGYTKGNVRVISQRANTMKSDANREEIEMYCKNILKYLDGEI